MVSRGRSFRGAIAIAVFTMAWIILGMMLFITGLIVGGVGLTRLWTGEDGSLVSMATIVGPIIVMVGLILILIGFLASFPKVTSETVAEEGQKKAKPTGSCAPRERTVSKRRLSGNWIHVQRGQLVEDMLTYETGTERHTNSSRDMSKLFEIPNSVYRPEMSNCD